MSIKRSTMWIVYTGEVLMFVMTIHFVIQYVVFQALNTLPVWPFLFVWVILIIALLFGGIYIYDFHSKRIKTIS